MAEVPEDLLDGAAAVLLHGEQPTEHAEGLLGEAPPLGWHRVRPSPLPADELLVEGVRGQRLFPGEVAGKHTEQQHTEGPDVGAVVHAETLVAGHVAELRRCVGDGAAHLRGGGRKLHRSAPWSEKDSISGRGKNATHSFHRRASAACHAKVGQLDLAALSVKNEDVLGLDVSVDQLLAVQVV